MVVTLPFNLIPLCPVPIQNATSLKNFYANNSLHRILISMGKGRKGVQSIIGGGRNTGGILKNSIVGPKGMKTRQEEMMERIVRASEGKYWFNSKAALCDIASKASVRILFKLLQTLQENLRTQKIFPWTMLRRLADLPSMTTTFKMAARA